MSTPDFTTTTFTALDQNGQPAPGVTFLCRMIRIGTGISVSGTWEGGFAGSPIPTTAVSDENGLVQFPGTLRGCTYEVMRQGGTKKKLFTVMSGSTYEIQNFIS